GIKKGVAKAFAGASTGKILDWLKGSAPGGISGGTRLIAGPDAKGDCSLDDFQNAFVTVCSLGMNFVVDGVSCGVVFISKQRPVVLADDILYAKAIGLMAGVGLATSLDVEASGMVYKVNIS
ncbi:MAG: hypothetical protein JWN04_910, partial [Myxococcaceae bacterium]|nr:hypothetical protein [Myxococcaceae bacterium]